MGIPARARDLQELRDVTQINVLEVLITLRLAQDVYDLSFIRRMMRDELRYLSLVFRDGQQQRSEPTHVMIGVEACATSHQHAHAFQFAHDHAQEQAQFHSGEVLELGFPKTVFVGEFGRGDERAHLIELAVDGGVEEMGDGTAFRCVAVL